MKHYCFITVRSSSSRLKKKCFLDFGNITVLEHIILRCIYGGLSPVICTTENVADIKIIKLAKLMNIKYFQGSEKNKILRWYMCSKKLKINNFHTIDADDLFFDWDAVKKSLQLLKKTKKDVILPSKVSREGGASEGYSFSRFGLEKMIKEYKILKSKKSDIEMIDNFLANLNKKTLNGYNYQIKKVRLTLDYVEDYTFFKKIRDKLGNFSHRKKINLFLKKNLNLSKINYFKNKEWSNRQQSIIRKT
jgi:spore coat polysaccharide biosynthesis protein SpsF